MSPAVADFAPSRAGLHFPNAFPEGTPALPGLPASVDIPGYGRLSINDASNGLCGGMVFTALDYFRAAVDPPPDREPPAGGSPLFRHLVRRLIDSWDIPGGVLRYLHLMNPLIPDDDSAWIRPWGHGRAWIMLRQEWPKVERDIVGGKPSPLGLIKVKSLSPMDLSMNHQVLAYAFDRAGDRWTVRVYDPNHPDNDDITMTMEGSDPRRPVRVRYTPSDTAHPDVYCFFRVDYRRARPPTW